jgi:hypothetical protein
MTGGCWARGKCKARNGFNGRATLLQTVAFDGKRERRERKPAERFFNAWLPRYDHKYFSSRDEKQIPRPAGLGMTAFFAPDVYFSRERYPPCKRAGGSQSVL